MRCSLASVGPAAFAAHWYSRSGGVPEPPGKQGATRGGAVASCQATIGHRWRVDRWAEAAPATCPGSCGQRFVPMGLIASLYVVAG